MTSQTPTNPEHQVTADPVDIPHFLEPAFGRDDTGKAVDGYLIHGQGETVFLTVQQIDCLIRWGIDRLLLRAGFTHLVGRHD